MSFAGSIGAIARFNKPQSSFLAFARAGLSQGLSGNSIISAYSKAGVGLRREAALEVLRYARGIAEYAYSIKNVRKDYFPDPAKMTQAKTNIFRDYSYNTRIGYRINPDGTYAQDAAGNRKPVFVTVTTNTPLSIREIEEEAEAYADEDPSSYSDLSVEDVVVVAVVRK